ncbi:transposase, partial [Vibrio parahaemolyticus]
MILEFKNLKDLLAKTADGNVCRGHLEALRWGGNPQCPFCGA